MGNKKSKPKKDVLTKATESALNAAERAVGKTANSALDVIEGVLKAVLPRGLTCGQCDGCKGKAKWREHWFLHKFRATFATWPLWAGGDLRTVQDRLGHKDMESTMRYLKPSRSQQVREKVNEIFAY